MLTALLDRAPWLLVLAGSAMLAAALTAQYGFDMAPCELCIYQRWAYLPAIGCAVLALAFRPGMAAPAVLIGLSGASLLAGAGIAFYHVGVEQLWWAGTEACVGQGAAGVEALLNAPVVRCDEIPWSLFGISIAGFNFLISLLLGAAAIAAAALSLKQRRT